MNDTCILTFYHLHFSSEPVWGDWKLQTVSCSSKVSSRMWNKKLLLNELPRSNLVTSMQASLQGHISHSGITRALFNQHIRNFLLTVFPKTCSQGILLLCSVAFPWKHDLKLIWLQMSWWYIKRFGNTQSMHWR